MGEWRGGGGHILSCNSPDIACHCKVCGQFWLLRWLDEKIFKAEQTHESSKVSLDVDWLWHTVDHCIRGHGRNLQNKARDILSADRWFVFGFSYWRHISFIIQWNKTYSQVLALYAPWYVSMLNKIWARWNCWIARNIAWCNEFSDIWCKNPSDVIVSIFNTTPDCHS